MSKDLHEEIQDTMPLYDPWRTPSDSMGRVAELFRTWPDVLRSDHPRYSFAAWGKEARVVDFAVDWFDAFRTK